MTPEENSTPDAPPSHEADQAPGDGGAVSAASMEGEAVPGADGTTDTELAEGEGEVPADGGNVPDLSDIDWWTKENVREAATNGRSGPIDQVLAANEIVLLGEGPDWAFSKALVKIIDLNTTKIIATYHKDISKHGRSAPPYTVTAMDTVDATSLHPDDWARDAVLWFQMPWRHLGTAALIRQFLVSAAGVQDPGAYLILGMCSTVKGQKDYKYFEKYELPASVTTANYELVGINRGVVEELLEEGYTHHSSADTNIHWCIKDGMVLLIFKRVQAVPQGT